MSFTKIYNNLDSILRNLLVAGNIVTVSYEQMREIRKELDRFVKPVIYGIKINRIARMENNEQSDNERNGTIRGYFAFKSKGEWQTNTVFIDHVFK